MVGAVPMSNTIDADLVASTDQVVREALNDSKEHDYTVTIATRDAETYRDVSWRLYAECESHDGEGLFWGADLNGVRWQVQLICRA